MRTIERRKGGNIRFAVSVILLLGAIGASIYGFIAYRSSRRFAELREMVLDATLYIESTRDGKKLGFGSGFFVSPKGNILTNYHVVENAEEIRIRTRNGETYGAGIFMYNKQDDIAYLQASLSVDVSPPFLSVRSLPPQRGENIIVAGTPFGIEQAVSRGQISAVAENEDEGTYIQITAPIAEGSSGGPVVDEEGRVVGMSTLILFSEGARFNYAVASTALREYVTGEQGLFLSQERQLQELKARYPDVDLDDWSFEGSESALRGRELLRELEARNPGVSRDHWPAKDQRALLEIGFPGLDSSPDNSVPSDDLWTSMFQLMILQKQERLDRERNQETDPYLLPEGQVDAVKTPALSHLPLPTEEGFMDNPWGSSVIDVKKRLQVLVFRSSIKSRKILTYYMNGTYKVFGCEGTFVPMLFFYDNRLGSVHFEQHPSEKRNLAAPLIRELTSLYGFSPRQTSNRNGIFDIYNWDRGSLQTAIWLPRSDAAKPGGFMSFYLPSVRFTHVLLSSGF
jgi:hypothetical protein